MKISVIIPTLNRTSYLKMCLKSLLDQTRQADEIIVVVCNDDNDTVSYLDQLRIENKYRNIRIVIQKKNGFFDALNLGLRESSGELICFIDDDGCADRNWIEKMYAYYQDSSIGGVGGPCIPMYGGKPQIKKTKIGNIIIFPGIPVENHIFLTERVTEADHLRGCNMSFRRDVLEKNGGFDSNLKGDGFRFEMDVSFRAKRMGYRIIYDPKIIVHHYEAPRDNANRYSSETIYNNSFNNTYVFLKHYSFIRKLFFIPFDIFVGSYNTPGIMAICATSVLRLFLKGRYLPELKMLVPSLRGKIHAMFFIKNITH